MTAARAKRAVAAPLPDAQIVIAVCSTLRAHDLTALLDQISRQRGVLVPDLCGRTRCQSASRARHELWWRIKNLTGRFYSTNEIARMFRCDCASVRHGIRAHERRIAP